LSIIKHVSLQKIVAHDFRYDLRILPIHNGLSDHDVQCLHFKNLFIKKKKLSGKYKTRLFTIDTISQFQKLLLEETLGNSISEA